MVLCFSNPDIVEDTSRKPSESNFKQQKLKAWQPILTASTILPVFFIIGVLFIPIGIGLLVTSNKIQEHTIEYSASDECKHCKTADLLLEFKAGIRKNCQCHIIFNLKDKYKGDVYFYYGLSNFYQNHRRYVRSRDDNQIHGDLSKPLNSNCEPFEKDINGTKIAPCGAIANSMFSDTFTLKSMEDGKQVGMTYKDIAWSSDRKVKFRNPKGADTNATLKEKLEKFAKPKYWPKPIYELDDNIDNNGFKNQDFIVWMRVAAFPTFRKFYRKLIKKGKFENGLPAGKYNLTINYNYPVEEFKGKKRFILTTISWMGGKNPFLGIAYIVVGCICLTFGFIFLAIHLKVRSR